MAFDRQLAQRNGHLPVGPGPADRGFAYPRYHLAGATPSVSLYDADFGASESDEDRKVTIGWLFGKRRLPLSAPTITRTGLVSAQLNSLPAARFFQGYTGAGTGRNWSGGAVASVPRTIHQNFNPHAQGVNEPNPATTYNPFPSPAALYPKLV